MQRDGWQCQIRDDYCLGAATTIDHITAWFLGGGDDPANLQAACEPCNTRKGARESAMARAANKRKALHRSARLPHPAHR
jgi:5-methylcytosine-specific restriction endonuclease McrA